MTLKADGPLKVCLDLAERAIPLPCWLESRINLAQMHRSRWLRGQRLTVSIRDCWTCFQVKSRFRLQVRKRSQTGLQKRKPQPPTQIWSLRSWEKRQA